MRFLGSFLELFGGCYELFGGFSGFGRFWEVLRRRISIAGNLAE